MTKLEEKLSKAFLPWENGQPVGCPAAYQVAKRYIEQALSDAFNQAHYSNLHPDVVKRMEYNEWAMKWLKENGIIE